MKLALPPAHHAVDLGPWRELGPDVVGQIAAVQRRAGGKPRVLRIFELPLPNLIGYHNAPAERLAVMTDHYPQQGWHLSISHQVLVNGESKPGRYPTWDEIADARYRFVPDDVTMVMHLPPRAEYVNVHRTTFHLFQHRG